MSGNAALTDGGVTPDLAPREARVEKLGDDIWTVGQPLVIGGADLGTRMTVVRIGDELMLHSPVRIDDALAGELDRLGRVRWLVAPCAYHHLFVRRAKERWPDAVVLAVPGVQKKQPKLAIDGMLPDDRPREWAESLDAIFIAGMPRLDEIAVLHRPSKTLVLTDFLFNIPHLEGWLGRTMLKMAGSYGGPKQTKLLRFLMKDRTAVKASRDAILAWDFDRVSVCHRDVIERGGKDVFARATEWIG